MRENTGKRPPLAGIQNQIKSSFICTCVLQSHDGVRRLRVASETMKLAYLVAPDFAKFRVWGSSSFRPYLDQDRITVFVNSGENARPSALSIGFEEIRIIRMIRVEETPSTASGLR